jgi:vitamin B12 transporter
MTHSLLSRVAGWSFTAFACVATALPGARAQTVAVASPATDQHEAVRLDNFVVSASRTPQDIEYTPSSVSVLSPTELAASQITDLRTALAAEPGVIIVNTGAVGSQSAVMMRGANSYQTLFVVDGVRMNDRSAAYQNFLGQADLGGIDRIEVLRGPQSTLYGSSAMGGVITVDTTHGCGETSGSLSAVAGSFNTVGGSASVQGGTKTLGYSGFISREVTDNDRPNNNSKVWSYSTRLEVTPSAMTLVGVTFRGQDGDYQEPGVLSNKYPGTVEAKNYLGTAYGQLRIGPDITSRLTVGWHQREYSYASDYGVSYLRNTRDILDWQNTWTATQELEVVAGANYERSYYTVSGEQTSDTVKAGYVSATYRPIEALTLTGGVRGDDYSSAGSAITWRMGASWVPAKGSKLRATYGTGFSAPGSDDRFGVATFGQLANPNLHPEKSGGWDVGFDQEILGDALTTSVTYFHNRFTDLFNWYTLRPTDFKYDAANPYNGRTINVGRATTSGVELALNGKLNTLVSARVAYTYLDARDDILNVRLIRRPRHVVDAEARFQVSNPWIIGAGVHVVAGREDMDFKLYTQLDAEDYTTVRLFTSYALTKNLLLKVRIENALDEKYAEASGYPALPRAVYGSVEWKF